MDRRTFLAGVGGAAALAIPDAALAGVSGRVSASSATFTPAAGAHGAVDVIGAATEFKGLSQAGGNTQIISASLLVATGTLVTTTWRVHLYSITPPSALADNAPFDITTTADRDAYLGYIDLAQLVDVGSTLYIQSDNLNKGIRLGGGRNAFGYLVAQSGITTENVAHVVTLFAAGQ